MRLSERTLPDRLYATAFALLIVLVLLWGVGHRFYETLLPQFAAVFGLTGTGRALTESGYQIVYFFGAIPAAIIARSFGYKIAILIGLGSVCIGAFTFYPAAETQGYSYFLFAVMVMAFGWILLEVAGNPLAMALGSTATAVRRLNLVQAVYPLGSLLGIYSARWLLQADLALPKQGFTYSMAHPYIVLGVSVLLLAYLFEETRFPPSAQERRPKLKGVIPEVRALLSEPLFVFAIVAQFSGILVLGTSWFLADHFFRDSFAQLSDGAIANVFVGCLILFALGRIAATALMWQLSPARVLFFFSLGGVASALLGSLCGGEIAAFACLALSFFIGPAWPTIFGLAVGGRGLGMKLAAAVITMGGALGAVAYHFLMAFPPRATLLVAAAGFMLILAYTLAMPDSSRKSRARTAEKIRMEPI
ncbi:MAG: hypothetical protein P4L57_11275 [Rhizomicrobium sp.]|nr:hypothetical protein [Rhizomicrobium sp.]